MSQSITFADAAARFSGLVTTEVNITDAIQEVVDRAYEMGRWRGMIEEIECTTNQYVTISENTEKQEVYFDFDPDQFDGAIGFRHGGRGYGIKTLVSLYQEDTGVGNLSFIDIGDVVVDDVTYRRYRAPRSWNTPITELYALLKKVSKSPLEDTDILPIKSIGALKSGILAVAYENVNDMERADAHWQKFMLLMERAQKQYNGGRKISIRFNDNIRKRPTQFK
jgi:hypothetical protein